MKNETQLERYKRLLEYLDRRFKADVTIDEVEEVCYYSYRNINRIFMAIHHETIGKYVKRMRLEKAAEYLKFSDRQVSDIACEVGYSDLAAFSKAFKSRFNCSPSAFRDSSSIIRDITIGTFQETTTTPLQYELETLPELEVLYLEHRGAYENIEAIKHTWEKLFRYASKMNLVNEDSIFLAEILDDNEISESVNCRYHVAILLNEPLNFIPKGLFRVKTIPEQKYAKFLHKGSHESSEDTYNMIYARWISDVDLELEDLPTLEFFLNDENDTPAEDLLTEIYIPVK